MDQFFTSLNKRQTMLLLTAITFGGQEGVASLEHLAPEEGELLLHRAHEIMQIPREKRIPLLVQEIKKLVKDRRGQLWSAEPDKLAALIQKERGALAEVVLRALPGVLAEAVRAHLPQKPLKLTREVRPQVLDIVRWKLEERLSRSAGSQVSFKFSDVLMLQPRELLTVCDRLGARVLGPALAGLPEAQRDQLIAALPPDQKSLASKSVQANAPRKLPEEESKEQLGVHDGLKNLSGAIRSAGTQRLARACVSQSAEFAARMLERHRGDFGSLLAKWVRDERAKPVSRTTDGGRADIVADLERLAARGLIDRPVRLTPQRPALNPPPARASVVAPVREAGREPGREPGKEPGREPGKEPGREPAGRDAMPSRGALPQERLSAAAAPAPRRDIMAEREARRAGAVGGAGANPANPTANPNERRDPMAERAARRAGAMSSRDPRLGDESPEPSRRHPRELSRLAPLGDEGQEPSRKLRASPRESVVAQPSRREPGIAPDPTGARIGPPPSRDGSRVGGRPPPPPEVEHSRSRPPPSEVEHSRSRPPPPPPPEAGDGARAGARRPPPEVGAAPAPRREREGERRGAPPARVPPPRVPPARLPPRPVERTGGSTDPEGSRVISSPGVRSQRTGVRPALTEEPERPPRVLSGKQSPTSGGAIPAKGGEGTSVERRPRPVSPSNSGRGPRGGSR
ncbi:hypothetical protein [Hyalangium versicolor]|uniref:hypothetical protein n=1 Tax=Hyalangium versicolor TaxID=2861190 RepID=UPI001CC94105|nr:hypothetical protein [Hyalangium versicolor]